MNIEKALTKIPLFQGLGEKHHKRLADIVVRQVFKRGETIFSEGDAATGFYVVSSGKVKIFKLSAEGKEQILHIFEAGEPFGEVPVFSDQPFPAYAETLTDTQTLFFPKNDFIGLIKSDPSLALNMLSVLSLRLKRFTALIEDLSLKEVPGRLAAYLLYISDRNNGNNEVILDISKGQMANLLGTIPETLSRILARMGKEGVIESKGKRLIYIRDRDAVEKLASGEMRLA